ncbi:helix-turn-helix domain-containing protein [Rhodococcus artemisiae]|uniref:Helix-turn-helix domain-containing protein n=1 Tax=Rhodococcus artemisiae TaxID=714159 RepID=A0ABU7L6D8_9NOCA|nr:helix-turn-helix domain-containing protein [Rhodococcus artemisiae]MEE2057099.1 helix-turn-helix domain-containing protein [Rhodococcus artemisiae]
MTERKARGTSPSPPTDRVVSIVETLVRSAPATSADLADALGLSRSTVGSILTALREHGWVRRLPDLSYVLGPSLAGVAEKARRALPVPDGLDTRIETLAGRVGCGVALSLVEDGKLAFVAITEGTGHIPAGIEVGLTLSLQAPGGAAVVAFADSTMKMKQRWLDTAPVDRRTQLEKGLAEIVEAGVGVWGATAADIERIDLLTQVLSHLPNDPASRPLRGRVQGAITDIGGRLYDSATLSCARNLPISYLSAPVFDSTGRPLWELQIGPLRAAVSPEEREHYIRELKNTAAELSSIQAAAAVP